MTYGMYTYKTNPTVENEYVLDTQKNGWILLSILLNMTDKQVMTMWRPS